MFGSRAAIAVRERKTKTKTQNEVGDFLYELPDDMPDLELGDELISTLGTEAEDLFDPQNITKKDEEDEVLKDQGWLKRKENLFKTVTEKYTLLVHLNRNSPFQAKSSGHFWSRTFFNFVPFLLII